MYERRKLRGPVQVSWVGKGEKQFQVTGSCVDVSVRGLLAEIPSEVPVGTKVQVWIKGQSVVAEGVVRHCRVVASWYRVGLKMNDVLLVKENYPDLGASLVKA